MPGYEPFLLCDFHVHTKWSDGRLSVREVVDLYGSTGKFDVIAITDHILMKCGQQRLPQAQASLLVENARPE
jgi:predicted metal-dependent phosphoesterase TrpH